MKRISNVIWGLVLVAAGLLFALNALEITDIDVFFDGWWTLFLIIPCGVGLFTDRDKTGNLIGLTVGIFLLLCCQGVLDFAMVWKLLLPAIIVIIGLKLLLSGLMGDRAGQILSGMKEKGQDPKVGCATFSSCSLNYDGEVFDGAELTAAFGAVKCDLRGAVIREDCAIRIFAAFGSIEILTPETVHVKVSSTGIFGGVSNKAAPRKDVPTLYVSGTCLFGGVEIR